ncbi:MAG TPA: hypothetical protein VK013_02175 [Myxococcaceae bacterium]|nr:hypothetical protein [Myxococcaceae bacterium]
MPGRLLIVSVMLVAVGARAEGTWDAHFGIETGLDSNPGRNYALPQQAAPMASALGGLRGRWHQGGLTLFGTYDAGARLFPTQPWESTLAQVADTEVGVRLHREVQLVAGLGAKDRRGQREYSDLHGRAGVRWSPDAQLEVTLLGRFEGFWFRPNPNLDFFAPGASIEVRYRFDRHHQLALFGEGAERAHRGLAREADLTAPLRERFDTVMLAGAHYTYRGGFIASVGYDVLSLQSNSFGESMLRHRGTARFGVPLFWELTLFGHLALQLAQYPDGVYASPELFLLDDAENQNALTLELTRPLTDHLELALRYAFFENRLGGNHLHYLRQVGTLGITWRR